MTPVTHPATENNQYSLPTIKKNNEKNTKEQITSSSNICDTHNRQYENSTASCGTEMKWLDSTISHDDDIKMSTDTNDYQKNDVDLSTELSLFIPGHQLNPTDDDKKWIEYLDNKAADFILLASDIQITPSQLDEILSPIKSFIIMAPPERKEKILDSFEEYFINLLYNFRVPKNLTISKDSSNLSTVSLASLFQEFRGKISSYEKHITTALHPLFQSSSKDNEAKISRLLAVNDILYNISDNEKIGSACNALLNLNILPENEIIFLRKLVTELEIQKFDEKALQILETQASQILADQKLNKTDILGFNNFFKIFKEALQEEMAKPASEENKEKIISAFNKELIHRINLHKQNQNFQLEKIAYLDALHSIYHQLQNTAPSQENEMRFWKIGHSYMGGFSDLRKFRTLFHNNQIIRDDFKYRFIDAVNKGFITPSEALNQLHSWLKRPFSWSPVPSSQAELQP